MGVWEFIVMAMVFVFSWGIPIFIFYIGFRVVKRFFKQLDQIQDDLKSIKDQLHQPKMVQKTNR